MPEADRRLAYLALTAGILAISWSAIFVRWTHMPGVASAFYRVLFAAMALWSIRFFQTVVSLTLLATAPLTALLALTIFAERMSRLQVAGGVLVLVGVWMANRVQRPANPVAS